MDIRNISSMKATAAQRLDNAGQQKKLTLIYAGLTVASAALVTVVKYVLGLQINQTGGLSNMGTRSILSTISTMLPLALSMFLMCLDVGYIAAMLRISRDQYTSPNTLRAGFQRFWPLLRYTLLQSFLFIGLMVVSAYFAVQIFLLTPLSRNTMAILAALSQGAELLDPAAIAESAVYPELVQSMLPALLLTAALYTALCIPVLYQYRMTYYVLLDKPGLGAMAAMRESRKMMRRNRFKLFRVDLSFWWYHGLCFLASLVCYGDTLLPALGIALPFSETASYFIAYALFLAMEFGIYYFLRNRVEVTYALAYEAVKPEEPKNDGIILGNIFQM